MLSISAMPKASSTFNRFQGNPLVIKCTLVSDKYEHNLQALVNTDVTEYAFIDEKTAQLVCETLQITLVMLSRPKLVNGFDDRETKPITHVIYSTLTVQNHSEITTLMFIIKIEAHPLILGKSWMNAHEVILNMKNDKIIFKLDRCSHFESFKTLRVRNERSTPSREIYLLSSVSSIKTSISVSPQKYQIIQRRSTSTVFKIKSPSPTVENFEDEEESSLKSTLEPNSRYAIEEIDKEYPLVKLSKEERRIKAIRDFQQSTLVEISIRRPSLVKKSTRRSSRRPKVTTSENGDYEQDLDFDALLNVFFIDAAVFQFLAESRGKEKEVKTFSLIMKKLDEIIDNIKENLIQVEPDPDIDSKKTLKIMEATVEELKRKVPGFFKRFEIVLNPKEADKLFSHRFYDHKIELTEDSAQLFRSRVYPLSPKKFEALQKYLHENLQKEFINSSKTLYASFILFVVKSNDQFRLCVDYRKLNVIIKRNSYPIPLIEEILARVIDCKFLFKLDIISAFNKFRMNSQSEEFTIFICSLGIYKYHVLLFGLINGSTSWQHYMNDLLFEYINHFCQMYLNDILIYSKTRRKHERHLTQIFQKLEEVELQVDIKKCEFFQTEVSFLDVILSTKDLRMNSKKVQDIVNWVRSICIKKMQVFVDFCNFYRRFIKAFSKLAKPLTRMIKKEADFEWIDLVNEAFEALKKQMIETSIFRHYDRSRKTILKIDFSDWCLGGVLSQYDDERVLHSVTFFSKKMILVECNYEIYDKKLLAIIRCLEHWRFELEDIDEFVEIYIDHKNLKIFMTSKKLTSRQVRWIEILIDYNIKIQYQFEAKNVKVDALTRMLEFRPVENDERELYREQILLSSSRLQLCSIDVQNDLYERVMQANRENENCISHRQALVDGQIINEEISLQGCSDRDGVLFKNKNLWISDQLDFMIEIIRDAHDQSFCAHSDMNRTEKLIKRYYYWSSMRLSIKRYIRNCHKCQRSKFSHDDRHGLLTSLSIPSQRWVDISIDFITELFDFRDNNAICIIIDRLIKKRHYALCVIDDDDLTIEICVKILLHYVFRTHDLFFFIVSDRDDQFVSRVWKTFCKRLEIKCKLFIAFQFQIDDQIERANQDIETRLRQYCNYRQDDWADWIDIMKFADNNDVSATTELTSFFINKGYHSRMTFGPNLDDYEITRERLLVRQSEFIVEKMNRIIEYAKANAADARQRMTARVNKIRLPISFEIENYVWLDRRHIKTARSFDKLDDKKLESFKVIKRRDIAYELELFDDMHIHLVFHSWLLRKDLRDSLDEQQNDSSEPVVAGEMLEWKLDDIVQSRYRYHRLQYRCKWSSWNPHDRTWYYVDDGEFQNAQSIVNAFHEANSGAAGPALRND